MNQFFKIKYLLVLPAIFLIGCSNPEDDIKTSDYLPSADVNTSYIYDIEPRENGIKSGGFQLETIIRKIDGNCFYIDEYMILGEDQLKGIPEEIKVKIKNNKTLSDRKELCSDNNKIYGKNNNILYQKNKDWKKRIDIGNEFTMATCKFISIKSKNIFNKERKVIHTKCYYKINDNEFNKGSMENFLAEGIGVYKTIFSSGDVVFTGTMKEIK